MTHKHICPQCSASHSTPTGHTIVPLNLLSDVTQICHWLSSVSHSLSRGEAIDPGFLELIADQGELVRAWTAEFTTTVSYKTEGDSDD